MKNEDMELVQEMIERAINSLRQEFKSKPILVETPEPVKEEVE